MLNLAKKFYKQTAIATLLFINASLVGVWINVETKELPKTKESYPEIEYLAANTSLSFGELSKYFTELAESRGAKYAFDVLKIAPMPPNTDMHLLGHVVGDVLYKQQAIEGIKICTQDFRNACSHSIVVGLLLEKGEGVLPQIADICREAPGGLGAYTMCFHGLGHGVLAYAGYDVPKAVTLCEKTGTNEHNQRESVECIGGGIMEIVGGGFHDKDLWEKQSKKYLTKSNPLFPCSADFMPISARPQCYVYLTPHLFKAAGGDIAFADPNVFKKAFPFCDKIDQADASSRQACYGGFGKEFIGYAINRDIRDINSISNEGLTKIYEWCQLADNETGKGYCVNSALVSLYWGGENSRTVAIRFCNTVKDSKLKSNCFRELIEAVAFYIKDSSYKKSFCEELPPEEQSSCKTRLI